MKWIISVIVLMLAGFIAWFVGHGLFGLLLGWGAPMWIAGALGIIVGAWLGWFLFVLVFGLLVFLFGLE